MNFDSTSLLTSDERVRQYQNPVNLASLNQLAKLFATEDLNVIHDPSAHTASFNTGTRTLALPAWINMPKVCYLLFTGHEIGHALYTPVDAFDNALIPAAHKSRSGYKSVLNVTEDVRIEKRVKRKYPGLRSDFIEGYKRLIDAGFFGDSLADVAMQGNIADRLNVRFKCGSDLASMIPFHNDDERSFLDRGYALESFDEAVILANHVYEYMMDNQDEDDNQDGDGEPCEDGEPDDSDQNPDSDSGSSDSGSDGDFGSDDAGDSSDDDDTITTNDDDADTDGDEGSSSSSDGDDDSDDDSSSAPSGDDDSDDDSDSGSDGDDDSDDDSDSDSSDGEVGTDDAGKGDSANSDYDPSSKTDIASRDNVESLSDSNGAATRRCAIPFDRVDYTKHVHDTKRILEEFAAKQEYCLQNNGEKNVAAFQNDLATECKKYISSVKPVVSLMAKEFDMKKAADQHRRSSTSRTGVINVGKLHAYKYEEDLFLRKSVMPDAKNHGMVMLLDLSGSMQPNMAGTLEQLINLVLFCKRVQIPFKVYGFNDALRNTVEMPSYKQDDVAIDEEVYLREFISSDLKAGMFKKALEYIFFMKEFWALHSSRDSNWLDGYWMRLPDADSLSSTPMNDALILSAGLVSNFRDKTGVQICNLVILSDGESNPLYYRADIRDDGTVAKGGFGSGYGSNEQTFLYDELTHRTSLAEGRRYDRKDQTAFILDGLKARTDVRIVGFYVLPSNGRNAKSELRGLVGSSNADGLYADLKKDGAVVTGCDGYDVRFAIQGGSSLNTDDSNPLDSVADGAKVAQIRSAFKKGSKGKIKSRVLLKKFIETIS